MATVRINHTRTNINLIYHFVFLISGINIISLKMINIYNWTCLLSSVIISVYYNRIENKTIINCASYLYLLFLPSY